MDSPWTYLNSGVILTWCIFSITWIWSPVQATTLQFLQRKLITDGFALQFFAILLLTFIFFSIILCICNSKICIEKRIFCGFFIHCLTKVRSLNSETFDSCENILLVYVLEVEIMRQWPTYNLVYRPSCNHENVGP